MMNIMTGLERICSTRIFRISCVVVLSALMVLNNTRRDVLQLSLSSSYQLEHVAKTPVIKPQITFTNYGWFHPNTAEGLKFSRFLSTRGLVDAILAHERYNASAWVDLEKSQEPQNKPYTPVISFLDIETCGETNWPFMTGGVLENSTDVEGGRTVKHINHYYGEIKKGMQKALASPAMLHPDSRLVIFNCRGSGPQDDDGFWGQKRDQSIYGKVVVMTLTADKNQISHHNDFGIPPLPIKPVYLNETELESIHTCQEVKRRPHLISFMGRPRKFSGFNDYFKEQNNSNEVYAKFSGNHYEEASKKGDFVSGRSPEEQDKDFYYTLLKDSIFAATPRGDNLYSYRFSEVLSAGSIPVIYADNWVMPYTENVVDWSEVAILIPERKVSETMEILQSISDEKRCEMQKRALEVYDTYVKDSEARLRGILGVVDSNYQFRQNIMPSRRRLYRLKHTSTSQSV